MDHVWRDTEKEPLTLAELKKLIGARPIQEFVNPRSTPYRTLGLKDRKLTKTETLQLLLDEPNLIRRPIVVKGARYIFGFDREAYREL